MNAYQKREAYRKLQQQRRLDRRKEALQEERYHRCVAMETAYKEFMASVGLTVTCTVTYNKGWYYFRGKAYFAPAIDKKIEDFKVLTHLHNNPHLEIQDE